MLCKSPCIDINNDIVVEKPERPSNSLYDLEVAWKTKDPQESESGLGHGQMGYI
jgi:hypothetical protein